MIDRYEVRAHYIPALLCSAPFIAFGFYFIRSFDEVFWASLFTQTIGGLTMSFALYYLAAFTCRHTGKWIEDVMFSHGKNFPTTHFLLDGDDSCSPERKVEIYQKIKTDLGIDLKGKTADTPKNRQRINEAIGAIRQKFFKKNQAILQKNIQFGFSKNTAGGALVSLVASLVLFLLAIQVKSVQVTYVLATLVFLYLILFLYGLIATRSNSRRYAYTLFDEFLAS